MVEIQGKTRVFRGVIVAALFATTVAAQETPANPEAVDTVIKNVGRGRVRRCDHDQTLRHRFENDEAESLEK